MFSRPVRRALPRPALKKDAQVTQGVDAYLQTRSGAQVNPSLPTARGEALETLLAEAKAWLVAGG